MKWKKKSILTHVTFFTACNSALGMESRNIKNSQITASSVWREGSEFQPWAGRLNKPWGFWHAKQARVGEWLQIDFKQKMIVTKIATQGRPDNNNPQYVTSYKISFSKDAVLWDFYKENGEEKVGRFAVLLRNCEILGGFKSCSCSCLCFLFFFSYRTEELCPGKPQSS